MSDIAISVTNLSKSYLVGHKAAGAVRDNALRDVIARNVHNLARKTRDMLHGRTIVQGDEIEEFWALKDVSFEIKRGDVVGIIGRNGAGKSTLLKVLSRITEPTHGRIEISGRVASLLEVGTGFHSELSGRENIFLNGAILGMSRREIQRKFDEIVSFAEVEKFLDTPVKRYSSGMYVRLAFAVAAHLEPEILVVDEVLAVGDAGFQKKCLGKMGEVAGHGRTVLFVSHNMGSIKALCSRCAIFEQGKIAFEGDVEKAVSHYYGSSSQSKKTHILVKDEMRLKGNGSVKIEEISILNSAHQQKSEFLINEEIKFRLKVNSSIVERIYFWFFISNETGEPVISSHQGDKSTFQIESREYLVDVALKDCGLMPGVYTLSVGAFGPQRTFLDWVEGAIAFTVEEYFSNGKAFDHRLGLVDQKAEWSIAGI